MASPRLSKLLGDVNKFIDDNSTSATSFMNLSLSSNLSYNNNSSSSSSSSHLYYHSHHRSSRRRRSPTEISLPELEDFVGKTLPEFIVEEEWVLRMQAAVKTADWSELDHYLTTILQVNPEIPALIVAQLHNYRGLIHLLQGNSSAAIEAFTRALWLQSHLLRVAVVANSSSSSDWLDQRLDMAFTEHRLGVALGRNKQFVEAMNQMNYAIQSYENAQVSISDGCYIAAKEDLHEFAEARQLALLESSGRMMRRVQVRRCKTEDSSTSKFNSFRQSRLEQAALRKSRQGQPSSSSPFRRTISDQVTRGARTPQRLQEQPLFPVVVEVNLHDDSFSNNHDDDN